MDSSWTLYAKAAFDKKQVEKRIEALPNVEKLGDGAYAVYEAKGNEKASVLGIYSDEIRFSFYTNGMDARSKAINMARFLSILAFLNDICDVKMSSLYSPIMELLIQAVNIDIGSSYESMEWKANELADANYNLLSEIEKAESAAANAENENRALKRLIWEAVEELMEKAGREKGFAERRLQMAGLSENTAAEIVKAAMSYKGELHE